MPWAQLTHPPTVFLTFEAVGRFNLPAHP